MKKLLLGVFLVLVHANDLAADQQITPVRDGLTQVISFDNWEIRQGLVENSYLLIGRSRAENGHFWLNCDSNGLVNVAVPLLERNGRDRLRSLPITVWSDDQKRQELNLIVFENFVAVALEHGGARNDKLEFFLNTLQTAKRTFAISYNDRIFEYDVAKLPAARARFAQLCSRQQVRTAGAAQ